MNDPRPIPTDGLHADVERRGYPTMEALKEAIAEAVEVAMKPLRDYVEDISRFVRGDGSKFNNGIEGEVHRIRVELETHMEAFAVVKLKVDRVGWVLFGATTVGGAVGAVVGPLIVGIVNP